MESPAIRASKTGAETGRGDWTVVKQATKEKGKGKEAAGRDVRLSQSAYSALKKRILMGAIPPLGAIDEHALRDELGLGRTPIREALQRLAYDGLVTILPYRGTVATGIDMAELDQILEIRIPLEILAGRIAAQRVSKQAVGEMRALVEGYDVAALCADRKIGELLRLDQNFHHAVTAVTENRFLVRILDNLRDMTWRFHFLFYKRRAPHPTDSFNNYGAIIQGLASHDAERVEAALNDHFGDYRRIFPGEPSASGAVTSSRRKGRAR